MTTSQEFSGSIREVERGEGVLLTRRGRPIAKLVPHRSDKTTDPEWAAACQGEILFGARMST